MRAWVAGIGAGVVAALGGGAARAGKAHAEAASRHGQEAPTKVDKAKAKKLAQQVRRGRHPQGAPRAGLPQGAVVRARRVRHRA